MSTSDSKKVRLFPPLKNCFYSFFSRYLYLASVYERSIGVFACQKSMSIANAISMFWVLLLLLKRHEQSECHSLWFCPWFSFYSFNKLLKAFRHPSRPIIARLSDFKKLLLSDIKLQMADKMDFKNYFCRTLSYKS